MRFRHNKQNNNYNQSICMENADAFPGSFSPGKYPFTIQFFRGTLNSGILNGNTSEKPVAFSVLYSYKQMKT